MPTDIVMAGMLEPLRLEEDFVTCVGTLNMAGAQGKEFVVATADNNGDHVAVQARSILVVREVTDD